MKNIYLITSSDGKIREFQRIIPSIKSYKLELDEIQSLELNNIIEHKLKSAASKLKNGNVDFDYILVEDTSLFIDSLNGLPGPFVKFFLQSIKNEGICKIVNSYSENLGASAKTLIGLIDKEGKMHFFEGQILGTISKEPVGENGFGWDKIFIPKGAKKTFAQMSLEEKNNYSMRKIAIEKLASFLATVLNSDL